VPVVLGDSLLGVITLFSTEANRFSEHHRDLLESHVRQFVNELGSRSNTLDDANGSEEPSEREQLEHVFMHGHLYGQRIGVVLLHTGSADMTESQASHLIESVDQVVRESVRAADLTVRTSKDEVVLVLPHTDLATVAGTAERVATMVEQRALDSTLSGNRSIDYAIAMSPDDGATFHALLGAARSSLRPVPRADSSATVH
jgi:hypothetical protein